MTTKKSSKAKPSYKRLHFVYAESPGKELEAKFAKKLIKALGQTPIEKADAIVSVGGDGLLLETLRQHHGKPIYGIKAPGSESRAFWLDKGVTSAEKLMQRLERAHPINLMQLEAEITFSNGKKKLCHAFNEFAVERHGPQSAKISVNVELGDCAVNSDEIVSNGLIISTPMGSTGTSRTVGGSVVDICSKVVLVTVSGPYSPRGMAPGVLEAAGKVFDVRVHKEPNTPDKAPVKRPVRLDFDGKTIIEDDDGSDIERVRIKASHKKGGTILVTGNPALRAVMTMFR